MTRNQVYYWEYKRQKNADAETKRSNEANESIKNQTLLETIRSNQSREAETQRANMANEALKQEQNYETMRSNRVKESNDLLNITNSYITNTKQARAAAMNASANAKQAQIASINAQTRVREAEEAKRANKVKEQENTRHNLVSEVTARSSVAAQKQSTAAGLIGSLANTVGRLLGLTLSSRR